jgi:glycosyltransferase involved in cell wall biosynthesis
LADISVIIPLFNKGPYITRALNSILTQTFQDFEVIVVDDGSTDEGAEVVRRFHDLRIRLIQQDNRGVSEARNRGIENSRAELIAFLDADDEWLPKHLETLWKLRAKYPDAGAYTTAYLFGEEKGKTRFPHFSTIPPTPWEGVLPSYFRASALGDPPVSSSSVAIPKEIINEMGGFQVRAWYGEDEDLWARIALKYPIVFSWELGSIYHLEAANRACKKETPLPKTPFVIKAQKMILSNTIPEKILTDLKDYIANEELNRASWYIVRGRIKEATEILRECHTKQCIRKKYKLILITKIPVPIFHTIYIIYQKIRKF